MTRVHVRGVGLCGPGLSGWEQSRAILGGNAPYQFAPTAIAPSSLLPAAERRRAGVPVRLVLAAGQEAIVSAGMDPAATPTVFSSSGGDCDNVHQMCEALALPGREVSPTRFHNSVHNAAAGYWSIATGCREASTSLCGYDGSFAVGLLEAAVQANSGERAVALIAYDHPYPQPLAALRDISAPFGVALVLSSQPGARALAMLDIEYLPESRNTSAMSDSGLEALRTGVPAARSLPLLAMLARAANGALVLEYGSGSCLSVMVKSCS